MRRSALLNGQDRKQLLVWCLVGIAVGVMLVAAGLALRHLLGRARLPNRRRTPWPGIALLLVLSHRINLLLETLNRKTEARQRRLDGFPMTCEDPPRACSCGVRPSSTGEDLAPTFWRICRLT